MLKIATVLTAALLLFSLPSPAQAGERMLGEGRFVQVSGRCCKNLEISASSYLGFYVETLGEYPCVTSAYINCANGTCYYDNNVIYIRSSTRFDLHSPDVGVCKFQRRK